MKKKKKEKEYNLSMGTAHYNDEYVFDALCERKCVEKESRK